MAKKHTYTRPYRKEGIKLKLTLYFSKKNIKKMNKLRKKDACTILSMASVVEDIVNEKLDGIV